MRRKSWPGSSDSGEEMKCFGLDEEQNGSEDLFGTLEAREKGGGFEGTVAYTTAFGGGNPNAIGVATTLNSKGAVGCMDFESETFVAHSLRGEGFDASEDGTGARTGKSTDDPRAGIGIGEDGDPMYTLQSGKQHAIAFTAGEVAPTLRAMPHDGSHANGGGQVAVAFAANDYQSGSFEESSLARPLTTSADRSRSAPIVATPPIAFAGMAQAGSGWAPPSCPTNDDCGLPLDTKRAQVVAFNLRGREGGSQPEVTDVASVRSASGGSSRSYVAHGNAQGSRIQKNIARIARRAWRESVFRVGTWSAC